MTAPAPAERPAGRGKADRKTAEKTANWVLVNRINDKPAADEFSCRYFGYYIFKPKASCRR